MTQSKPAKKKKTKIAKAKNNDKKSDPKQQPLPVDKRAEAEINLREMIKKAHEIHKDYVVRSSSNGLTPISSRISRSYSEKRKFSANNFYDEGSATRESLKKRIRTTKPENTGVTEVLPAKFRHRDSAEFTTGPKFPEGSHRKQAVTSGTNSDAFAIRKREIMARKRSSATFTVKESEGNKVVARERGVKIEDYHLGTMPFVSLEAIDKMKCLDWNSEVYPKKNLSRQKHRTERGHSITNLPKTKKNKCEKRTEKKEDWIKERNGPAETEKDRSSHVTKGNKEKCESRDSELIPIQGESPCKTQLGSTLTAKSAVSSPTSVSSNFDTNLGTFSGAGDPFSSNTSHSYFSSDSDTSRIDKKFIQILKAVTQKNLNIDLDVKLLQRSLNTGKSQHGMGPDENGLEDHQQSELEQRLIKRINSLERKLGNTNTNVEYVKKGEEQKERAGDSVVVPNSKSPVVEQLWIKERTVQDDHSGVSLALNTGQTRKENIDIMSSNDLKTEVGCDVTKIGKSYDNCKGDDIDRNVEQEQKDIPNPDSETYISKPEEGHTERTEKSCNKAVEEAITKDMSTSEVTRKSVSPSKDEKPDTDGRKDASEKVETWSIIKRLEKAFQTLDLNLQDLESSDDSSSAKKKQPSIKKRVSFGKDKTNLHKMEAMKKDQEAGKCSSSKQRSKDRQNPDERDCIQYKVESNGSGDKNMDYKIVRTSNKVEDLKGECSTVKNKADTVSYYTSDNRKFQKNGYEEVKVGLSESLKTIQRGKYSERTLSENRIHGNVARVIVNNAHTGGLIMDFCGKKNLEHGKRLKNIHVDDLLLCRKSEKPRSEYSLSASCSLSSVSGEDEFKPHKRMKKSLSYSVESNTSNQDLREISTSGTGDATTQAILQLLGRSIDWHIRTTKLNQPLPKLEQLSAQGMFQIEERNNELELKQIRERHKQIISEIKTSLNEIKKQHNLFAQLKTQTKKFHKDCHVKRKRISAYLKEAEQTYESRKAREPFYGSSCKYRRALSTDNYSHRMRRRSKLRNKTSDYDLEVMSVKKGEMGRGHKLRRNCLVRNGRCDSVLSIAGTMDETSSNEFSSGVMENTSADFSSTDTVESFRTVATSLKPGRHNPRYPAERGKISQMLSLEWNKIPEKPAWLGESTEEIPHYFLKLVEELNRIILTKNHRLDNLIKKASGSSNNSSHSNKTKGSVSSKSSGSSKHQNNRIDEASGTSSTGNKTSSSKSSGKGGSKQHKSKTKGNKKFGREKPAEVDEEVSLTRSRSLIQADPGGSSMDSIADREQEIVISESFPHQIQTDIVSLCPASCSHFDRQEEEFRYRKGDPSFQFRGQLLKCLDEHSKQCRRKTPEEERAYRRKMELERILRADEKTSKRPVLFSRDSDGHALDFDPHNSGRERFPAYVRHRQQSIIIDHNKGEENEESQTVLGHASRHSGVGRSKKAPHEYLRVDMKSVRALLPMSSTGYSESNYQEGRGSREIWKKSGKRNQLEQVPVNYFEISLNNPGSSADVSRDVDCQTDNPHDGDIYLWDESGSTHSIN